MEASVRPSLLVKSSQPVGLPICESMSLKWIETETARDVIEPRGQASVCADNPRPVWTQGHYAPTIIVETCGEEIFPTERTWCLKIACSHTTPPAQRWYPYSPSLNGTHSYGHEGPSLQQYFDQPEPAQV